MTLDETITLNKNTASHVEIIDLSDETKKVDTKSKLTINNLDAGFHNKHVLKDINLGIEGNSVTAFIGPSGCGKTTLIRCLNRMHEMTPGAYVKGEIFLDKININDQKVNPVMIKRRIGMVFQKPNPFPTMSIFDNVASGLTLNGVKDKKNHKRNSKGKSRGSSIVGRSKRRIE